MTNPVKARTGTAVRLSRVRAHTRTLLIDAALALFSRKSMAIPAIHEIAAQAGVGTGTFYNYFRTREELLAAAVVERSERLQEEIGKSSAHVSDPAERVSIGSRRFMLQADKEPMWAAGLLRIWSSTPEMLVRTLAPVIADLRAGRRRHRFTYRRESAAVDLLVGTTAAAMQRVLENPDGEEYSRAVAALILRGLGIEAAEAEAIARRTLPADADEQAPERTRRPPQERR